MNDGGWGVTAWAVDFCKAVRERPKWARILFRFTVGKYAYREFIGLQDHLKIAGISPYYDYGLERQKCHDDKVPWDFAPERKPIIMETMDEEEAASGKKA